MNLQHNRRRLFWLLQKWSSYTVWAHYAKQFDIFVKAYEEALATWPDGERPPEYNMRFAYLVQDLYPKGLAALAKGDRSVWREREDGYLGEAESASFRAMEGVTSAEINKYDGGEHGVPLYTVWTERLEQLRLLKEAATPCGAALVYEPRPTYADWHPIAYRDSECLTESYFQEVIHKFGPWPEPTPEPPPPIFSLKAGNASPTMASGNWCCHIARPARPMRSIISSKARSHRGSRIWRSSARTPIPASSMCCPPPGAWCGRTPATSTA